MLYLIWILTLVIAFYLGYQAKQFKTKIDTIEEVVKAKVDKPKQEPQSTLIDPTDPIQEARWEQAQMLKKLNPDE